MNFWSPRNRRRQSRRSPWQAVLERLEDRTLLAAPTVDNPIANQTANFGAPFNFTVPSDTFEDADGANTLTYSASGLPSWLTFTAATRVFSGTPASPADAGISNITVTVSDGTDTANDAFTLTVANVVPSFTKGANLTVLEDAAAQTVTNWATNVSQGLNESGQTVEFLVSNDNPGLFTAPPTISATGALSFTPAANANGSATVTVFLHDNGGTAAGGVDTSVSQTFTITVTAVNDEPSFTVGGDQSVQENSGAQTVGGFATNISTGGNDTGQTVEFLVSNNNPSLFSAQPAISANGTLTYTPAANVSATASATVTVTIRDNGGTTNGGDDTGNTATFTITVTAINAPPTVANAIADRSAPLGESFTFAIPTNTFTDPEGDAITLSATGVPTGLTFTPGAASANPTGNFTGMPTVVGTFNVTITATATGGAVSDTFTITVLPNAVPSFTKGANQTVLEDSGPRSVSNWATNISAGLNEPSQTAGLSFIVTSDNPTLFSAGPAIAANGTLTFTPADDANGTATITVRLRDSGGTANGGVDSSADQTFTITVASVNDAPSFALPGSPNQTVFEDSGAQTVANFATEISIGSNLMSQVIDSSQTVEFLVSNSNPSLFSSQPAISANGTLTYTPTANANGTATVTVTIRDNGGTVNGGDDTGNTETFTITINGVNDAPSFTAGPNLTVLEDVGAQTVTGWATNVSKGPANESAQTLEFIVINNNNPSLFSALPTVAADGTLSFTPAMDVSGTASITIALRDNGGTDNGGVNTSAAQTFTITVTSVNDAPSFTVGPDLTLLVNSGAKTFLNFVTGISAGPNESQTVDFIVSNDNQGLFTVQPTIAANGTLTFTPTAGAFGVATVSVQIHDNGGIANGGVDTSAVQEFTITITTTANGAVLTDPNPVYKTPGGAKLRAVVIDGLLNVQINGVSQRFYEPSVIETLTFLGGSKNDEIDLTGLDAAEYSNAAFNVVIKSGAGNDRIIGSFANDSIDAGSGNDTLTGGDGDDTLIGNAGTDRLVEIATADLTLDDTSLAGLGTDRLVTLEVAQLTADDVGRSIDASAFTRGAVTLIGGAGNDTLIGGSKNDAISGRDGDDELVGGAGNDTMLGGFGNDSLEGGLGKDVLIGGFDDDTIDGGDGRDTVVGGNGGAARGGDGVADAGDDLSANAANEINEAFKKLFAFE